jgi:hypothetical protein
MQIGIYKKFVKTAMEEDEFGNAPAGYWALQADGNGTRIATVDGVEQLRQGEWAQEVYIGSYVSDRTGQVGGWFTIPQIYSFAQRSMYGLSIGGR